MQLLEGQAYFPETREEIIIKGKANYISNIRKHIQKTSKATAAQLASGARPSGAETLRQRPGNTRR